MNIFRFAFPLVLLFSKKITVLMRYFWIITTFISRILSRQECATICLMNKYKLISSVEALGQALILILATTASQTEPRTWRRHTDAIAAHHQLLL